MYQQNYKTKQKQPNAKIIIKLSCYIIAIACLTSKIFYGFDIDEQYFLSMTYRVYNGQNFLTALWDPCQLSVFFKLPIMSLLYAIQGNLDHIVLIERTVGFCIYLLLGYLLYRTMKQISWEYAWIAWLTYIILLPRVLLTIEFCNIMHWFSTLMIICLYQYLTNHKTVYLLLSSTCLTAVILAYPTQILLFIVIELLLIFFYKDAKAALLYWIPCILVGGALIGYLLCTIGLSAIIENVPMIFMEGSHGGNIVTKFWNQLLPLLETIKRNFIFAIIFTIMIAVLKRKPLFRKENIIYFIAGLILYWPVFMFYSIFRGARWSIFTFARRYSIFALISIYLYCKYRKERRNELLFVALPLCMTIICMATTNCDIDSSSCHAFVSIAYAFIILMDVAWKDYKKVLSISLVGIFLTACYILALLPRVTSCGYYPIANLVESDSSMLNGIHVEPDDELLFTEVAELKESLKDEQMVFIGRDSIVYLMLNADVCAPLTISTPRFDEQWVAYYKMQDALPKSILIDKEYFESIDDFKENTLGKYLMSYSYNEVYNGDRVILLKGDL